MLLTYHYPINGMFVYQFLPYLLSLSSHFLYPTNIHIYKKNKKIIKESPKILQTQNDNTNLIKNLSNYRWINNNHNKLEDGESKQGKNSVTLVRISFSVNVCQVTGSGYSYLFSFCLSMLVSSTTSFFSSSLSASNDFSFFSVDVLYLANSACVSAHLRRKLTHIIQSLSWNVLRTDAGGREMFSQYIGMLPHVLVVVLCCNF